LLRLLWAAALVLPAFGAQAAVVFTSLYSFTGTNDGANPRAALVQGSDGYFYGTTQGGGTNGYGTVFKISANGALASLHSFTNGNDGAHPAAGLVQGGNGDFYSTTDFGGTNGGYGNLFKISANGALTGLLSFTGGNDGRDPNNLVQGSDGYFYGTTSDGGTNSWGTVFRITTNGALSSLYSFTGGNDCGNPRAGLVQGSDGSFYGTTAGSNPYLVNPNGTVFRIKTNGVLTSLHSFNGTNDGSTPNGLVQGSDGNLYGTTGNGSTNNLGTVFKISTNGALTTLFVFGTVTNWLGNPFDGAHPGGALVQGSDGNFYGTTSTTVFHMTPSGRLTTLYSGLFSPSALVQGSNGSFYGTTDSGGAGGYGTVFRLTMVPEFQAVTLTNGTLSLTWSTEVGGRYQLQYNSDLSSSNWSNLVNALTAAGATLSATDSVTNAPQRFYRVVLAP